ncbi:MAG TPA: BsuPI-related putative proteinase inhibitor [Bryobacteraceae bacterium]|nr:BsuPI-related putative proteinase inhibitor [Bryobacteraceae bacterium]
MHTITIAFAAALMLSQAAAAHTFLPLETGNYWTYRSTRGQETFTVSVGLPFAIGGQTYYMLNGYATPRLLVRQAEDGDLVWLDEEAGREQPLARFGNPGSPYQITDGGCALGAEVSAKPVAYDGPAGSFSSALEIRYQPVNCADTGFEQDLYLENIGLVRRTVTTFAGPRTYELIAARVGKWSFAAAPAALARLTFEPPVIARAADSDALRFQATLRISLFGMEPVRLRYSSSQPYELVIRDGAHRVVYRWSEGRAFLPVIREDEEIVGERAFTIDAEVPGGRLADGVYQVEAWLTNMDNPQFAASGTIRVETRKADQTTGSGTVARNALDSRTQRR